MIGRVAGILAWVGFLAFFSGVFGLTSKTIMLAGLALIIASLAAYFTEEFRLRGRF